MPLSGLFLFLFLFYFYFYFFRSKRLWQWGKTENKRKGKENFISRSQKGGVLAFKTWKIRIPILQLVETAHHPCNGSGKKNTKFRSKNIKDIKQQTSIPTWPGKSWKKWKLYGKGFPLDPERERERESSSLPTTIMWIKRRRRRNVLTSLLAVWDVVGSSPDARKTGERERERETELTTILSTFFVWLIVFLLRPLPSALFFLCIISKWVCSIHSFTLLNK